MSTSSMSTPAINKRERDNKDEINETKTKKVHRTETPPKHIFMTPSQEEVEFRLWARVPTFRKSSAHETALGMSARAGEKAVVNEDRPVFDWRKRQVVRKVPIPLDPNVDPEDPDRKDFEEVVEVEVDSDYVEREALLFDTSPFERKVLEPPVGYTYVIPYPDTSLIDLALRDAVDKVSKKEETFADKPKEPALDDPGNEDAFNALGGLPKDFRDSVGEIHYRYMCKQLDVIPSQHFIRQLRTDKVNFRYYGLDPRAMRPICEALSLNNYVKYLDLEDNWLTYDSAYHLTELFKQNDTIEGLNLTGCRLGPEGAWKLSEMLHMTQHLQELLLAGNELGDKGTVALAEGLSDNISVHNLDLSRNHMGSVAARALGSIMEDNWSLRKLDLSWNSFFDKDGFKALADGIIKNTGIVWVNLAGNALSVAVLKSLRQLVRKNQTLKYLDLSFNRLNDYCFRMLRYPVARSETLQTLRIGNNPITYSATSNFLQVFPRYNKGALNLLDMENIWVNRAFVQLEKEVRKDRPLFETINAGVASDYELQDPDETLLLMKRAYFEGMAPKKKKRRKDFGQFLLKAVEKSKRPIPPKKFIKKVKDEKLKLEPALVDELGQRFLNAKGKVDVKAMKEKYVEYFPDTALPPPKEKKKKKKKGKRKGKKGKKAKDAKHVTFDETGPPKPTNEATDQAPTEETKTEDPPMSSSSMGLMGSIGRPKSNLPGLRPTLDANRKISEEKEKADTESKEPN